MPRRIITESDSESSDSAPPIKRQKAEPDEDEDTHSELSLFSDEYSTESTHDGDNEEDLLPDAYQKRWEVFLEYLEEKGLTLPTNEKELGKLFCRYFRHLRAKMHSKASTLWSVYSMLNAKMQILHNKKLQDVAPLLKRLLKKYQKEDGLPKQSNIMSIAQISSIVEKADRPVCAYLLVRIVICILCVCGGLRCSEAAELQFSNMEEKEKGFFFRIIRKKKRKLATAETTFLVPKNSEGPCLYSILKKYLCSLTACGIRHEGRLMRRGKIGVVVTGEKKLKGKKPFNNQNLGKNQFYGSAAFLAGELGLVDEKKFTGHCWRRSAAQIQADRGLSAQQLQRFFGWDSEQMALTYLQKSAAQADMMAAPFAGQEAHPPSQQVLTVPNTVNTIAVNAPVTNAPVVNGQTPQVINHFHNCSNINFRF